MVKPSYRFLITAKVCKALDKDRKATFFIRDLGINVQLVLDDDINCMFNLVEMPPVSEMN